MSALARSRSVSSVPSSVRFALVFAGRVSMTLSKMSMASFAPSMA